MRAPSLSLGLAWILSACHVGPPPPPAGAAPRLGRVTAPVAEPGLVDDLRSGLGGALAERAGATEGPRIDARVLDAMVDVVAVSGEQRVHRARLVVAFQLLGPAPAELVLQGERSYTVLATDGLSAAQARADAFSTLALELAQDAVAWARQAPSASPLLDPLLPESP